MFAVKAWLAPPACREIDAAVVEAVTSGLMTLKPTLNDLLIAARGSVMETPRTWLPVGAPAAWSVIVGAIDWGTDVNVSVFGTLGTTPPGTEATPSDTFPV